MIQVHNFSIMSTPVRVNNTVVAVPVTDHRRRSQHSSTVKVPCDQSPSFQTTEAPPVKIGPLKSARVIVEKENLQYLFSKGAICRKCKKGSLDFSVINIGVASIPSI